MKLKAVSYYCSWPRKMNKAFFSTEERRYPCTVGNVACERDSQYSYFRGSRFPVDKRICVKTWVTRSIEEYAKFDEDAFISDVCYQIPRNVPRRRVFNKYRWYEFENAYIVIGHGSKAKPPTRSFRRVFRDPRIRGYRLKTQRERVLSQIIHDNE